MCAALREADEAGRAGELPIGAVVVHEGEVVARGRAAHRSAQSQLAHAELTALQQLQGPPWDAGTDAVLVTNVEPCPLCLGAVVMSDLRHIVYALTDSLAGAGQMLEIPYVQRHIVTYHGGLLAEEAVEVTARYGFNIPHA